MRLSVYWVFAGESCGLRCGVDVADGDGSLVNGRLKLGVQSRRAGTWKL